MVDPLIKRWLDYEVSHLNGTIGIRWKIGGGTWLEEVATGVMS
jgi:hypothetical protein